MFSEFLQKPALAALLVVTLGLPAMAQDAGALDKGKAEAVHNRAPIYSPYADRDFPTRPFFGDTHLHTSFSMDAGAFGARLAPRDAYRFARGEQITASMTTAFMDNPKSGVKIIDWEVSSSGYAAVWAKENTRTSIFDAMLRKETYATTGPRMIVRFFGGWDFDAKDAENRLPAAVGYGKGVPMGGDLSNAPQGKAPTFLVAALKDPVGANLDRYQIIKGWLTKDGKLEEKVYDIAWSGNRKPGADGKLPSVGSTIDLPNASYTNSIGAPELIAVWRDPQFDPAQRAFYYGRVIEIPTPRWTAYDAKRFGVEPPPGATMTVTERAYTSPIWYTPPK